MGDMSNVIQFKNQDWYLAVERVGCPKCGAAGDEPCVKNDGTASKMFHPERRAYSDELNQRAVGSDATSRWYRHEWRAGRIPAPPQPHGTEGAFQRHKRNGEDPCDVCMKFMRGLWSERNKARAAAARDERERVAKANAKTAKATKAKAKVKA